MGVGRLDVDPEQPIHAPIPRTGSMAAGFLGQVALFGGEVVVGNVAHWLRDTLFWTGTDWRGGWRQDSLPTRAFGGMAFDELDRSVVLFGGAVQGRLNNGTWTLAPS
jgi:hypothetical protein